MPRSALWLRSLAAIELTQVTRHRRQRTLEQRGIVQNTQRATLERQGQLAGTVLEHLEPGAVDENIAIGRRHDRVQFAAQGGFRGFLYLQPNADAQLARF